MQGCRYTRTWHARSIALVACTFTFALLLAAAALAVEPTNSGDQLRDGWYPDEPSLTPQLISGGTFGQLWSTAVEGQVYAQPLLSNGRLLVATENDRAYSLDPSTGKVQWSINLGTPWKAADIGCGDLTPNIGVTATPVIDPSTNTAYMTHKTYASGSSGPARWYMDAINTETGAERPGFPVNLAGTAQDHSNMTFNPTYQLQRPGLLLMNGVVYAAFGSHCDLGTWQGWIFGVSTSGEIRARWDDLASGVGAGIWQSGSGLTSDGAGTLMFGTGNGGAPSAPTPGQTPPENLGEAVVRLNVQPDGTLKAVDFFAPLEASQLDTWDADFASGGVTGLNDSYFGTLAIPKLAVAVGKTGYVYLLNRESLGGIMQGPGASDNVVQRLGPYGGVWSRPGVWPGEGGWIYIPTASGGNSAGGSSGFLRVYQYGINGLGKPQLSLQGTSSDAFGFTSSAPVITSNGTESGSALVWVIWAPNGEGTGAQLRAYDPVPVQGKPVLRWSAPIGTSAKFATPGVGAGKLYVGTRDGHVLGFGSPITPILTGPSNLTFGTVSVGSSAQRTLTLSATSNLTVTGISSSDPQFSFGTSTPAVPATLAAGQTIQIPVTFKPSSTGLIGASLELQTSAGSATFALSGTGQTAAAQLDVSPTLVSFGGTTVGGHLDGAATFKNVGGEALRINAIKLPTAPFTASGVPAAGSTIAAGASVTIDVEFSPTSEGAFDAEISMETTGGNGAIGLSGSAGSAGALQITGERLEYGSVQVGSTVSKSFTVTNTGGTQVALTKSKPPTGGAFTATTSLPEGTTLAPGQSVTESVSFTPSAPGYAGAVWPINGTDSTGLHEVTFTGSGTVPAPGSAWTVNGTAALVTGGVRLTSATSQQAGSAFFSQPIESRHIVLEYDQTINGGGGADGMAVAFADASSTGPDAVGAAGGGLGFSGIPGIAVAFDTYEGTGAPSNNFVGITDGPTGSAKDVLHWLTTATVASSLRSAVRKVKIEVLSGTITVWIDGTQVLSGTAALPSKVYLGFTGGTGAITDIHQATDVVLGGDTAPVEPPPANLKIQSTVNAPADSSQASQQFTFTGTCPSSFTTVPIGNGTLSPSLTGAVAGAVCSVAENAPGAGWSTEAIINGGKEEVPLTESGGKIIAPSFALAGGPNTIQFINTYTAPPSLVPDPTAGGWTMNKSASLTADELLLTPAAKNKKGDAFWPEAIDPRMLTVEFDATIGGGTGADGLTLLFADVTRSETKKIGATGEGLGVGGLPGVAIALVEASDASAGASNFAGISDGVSGNKKTLQWLATANLALPLQNTTTHVKVVNSAGNTTVSLDGTQVLSRALALPSSAYLAFTAATGKQTDRHAIAHLFVSSP